jgi:aspartate racemase
MEDVIELSALSADYVAVGGEVLLEFSPKMGRKSAVSFDVMKRIGIIGGMSWESTSAYYSLFNRLTAEVSEPWVQPRLLIDSVDFREIVAFQNAGDWVGSGQILADSARRLEAGGATVLGVGANTMHMNYQTVADAVSIPVLDIRDAIVTQLREMRATSMALLGTKYLVQSDFYSSHLEHRGIKVVKPLEDEIDELQSMIYGELTQGVVTSRTRNRFLEIAAGCQSRGAEVVGLCCTEFGMLVSHQDPPWRFIDSTYAHVRALLDH